MVLRGFPYLLRQRTIVGQPFQDDVVYPNAVNLGKPVRLGTLTYLELLQSALSNYLGGRFMSENLMALVAKTHERLATRVGYTTRERHITTEAALAAHVLIQCGLTIDFAADSEETEQ